MAHRIIFEDEIDNQNHNYTNLHEELIIKDEVEDDCSPDFTETNSNTECSTKDNKQLESLDLLGSQFTKTIGIPIENEVNFQSKGNIGVCKPKGKRRNKNELEMFGTDINEDDDTKDDKNKIFRKYNLRKTEKQRPRCGRGRGRGSGARSRSRSPLDRPSSPSSSAPALNVMHVGDMHQGRGLEQPLHVKRERRWQPPDLARPAPAPAELSPSSAPASDLAWEEQPSTSSVMVPSPALFAECIHEEQSAHPSPSPLVPLPLAPPRQYRRNLPDENLLDILHYGSDPDSDESGDDEEVGVFPNALARTLQSMLETPLDQDFGDGGEDDAAAAAARPGMPAAQPGATAAEPAATADVPPTATDQPRSLYDFEWKACPNPAISPKLRREKFSQTNVGPTTPRDDPYAIFLDIWDRPIMEYIACETNKYVQRVAEEAISGDGDQHIHPNSRLNRWRNTTADELYTYFALLLAMGVVVKSRLGEYWSSSSNVFCTPGFGAHMSMDRFVLLTRYLHFNDVIGMCGRNLSRSQAKLFKIQPILDHVNKKFQELYTPTQNIALDESLLMWKGALDVGQLIPNKVAKRGIKTYEVCESQTGYLWRFEVHAHTRSPLPPPQFEDPMEAPTPSVVLRLTQGLEHKGYTLWMDNFYNSPCLARRLKSLGFDCVGTLRTNRQFVPRALRDLTKRNMSQGQMVGLTSGDVDVMVWKDHNRVATISTYHGTDVQTIRGSTKPIVILDYNTMMGGVDKKDQLLAMYPVERKRTMVWYKKLFQRLLNISVLNSYIIHRQSSPSRLSHRNFRINLVTSLLSRHRSVPIPVSIAIKQNRRFDVSTPRDGEPFHASIHRIDEYDMAQLTPQHKPRRPRRNCAVCKKKVYTFCVGCNKPLCIKICFQAHHPITH